jgi:hypothetical protein
MNRLFWLLGMIALAGASPAASDAILLPPGVELEDGIDPDSVLRAVQREEILPLDRVLGIVRAKGRGEIIQIQLDLDGGRLIYDFDVLSPEGRLYAVAIDAVTGRILDVELEDWDDHDDDDDDG